MSGLATTDLLDLWERASRCGPHERAVHLLAWALPEHSFEALADLDLGVRDWHLLRLRSVLFGPKLGSYTDCPRCGEQLEVELDAQAIQGDAPPPAPCYIDRKGRRYRLPNSHDLVAMASMRDAAAAERELFVRCRLDQTSLDEVDVDEVDSGLSALADERNYRLRLSCALCDHAWSLVFDPGAYLWEDIRARARALLDDVHCLASAYGWSERDILAMGETRRNAYLVKVL